MYFLSQTVFFYWPQKHMGVTGSVCWITAVHCWFKAAFGHRSWTLCGTVDSRSTRSTVIKPLQRWLLAKRALFIHACFLLLATCLHRAVTPNLRVRSYCGNVIMIKTCLQKCKHGHRWLRPPLCVCICEGWEGLYGDLELTGYGGWSDLFWKLK